MRRFLLLLPLLFVLFAGCDTLGLSSDEDSGPVELRGEIFELGIRLWAYRIGEDENYDHESIPSTRYRLMIEPPTLDVTLRSDSSVVFAAVNDAEESGRVQVRKKDDRTILADVRLEAATNGTVEYAWIVCERNSGRVETTVHREFR